MIEQLKVGECWIRNHPNYNYEVIIHGVNRIHVTIRRGTGGYTVNSIERFIELYQQHPYKNTQLYKLLTGKL